jgi:hypothetical protein
MFIDRCKHKVNVGAMEMQRIMSSPEKKKAEMRESRGNAGWATEKFGEEDGGTAMTEDLI